MPKTKDVHPQSNPEQTSAAEIESVRAKLAEFLRSTDAAVGDGTRPEFDGDAPPHVDGVRDNGMLDNGVVHDGAYEEKTPDGNADATLNGHDGHIAAPSPDEDGYVTTVHRSAVKIKGRQGGVSLELGDGEWEELVRLLDERLVGAAGFFRGGHVVLDVGDRPLTVKQLRQVARLLEDHEMRLGVVRSTANVTQESALEMGVAATSDSDEEQIVPETPAAAPTVKAVMPQTGTATSAPVEMPRPEGSREGSRPPRPNHYVHRGSLRSGQILRKTESVVVIGDVNPGAQVISGGDVMVWGRLRGVAHAGADGNAHAVVMALDFAPTQLRIAGMITIAPESKRRLNFQFWKKEPPRRPESARIVDGRIVVEPWDEAKSSLIANTRR